MPESSLNALRTAPVEHAGLHAGRHAGHGQGLDRRHAVRATGAEMILANTYHLALRPGGAGRRSDLGGCTTSWAGTARS